MIPNCRYGVSAQSPIRRWLSSFSPHCWNMPPTRHGFKVLITITQWLNENSPPQLLCIVGICFYIFIIITIFTLSRPPRRRLRDIRWLYTSISVWNRTYHTGSLLLVWCLRNRFLKIFRVCLQYSKHLFFFLSDIKVPIFITTRVC